ncbi:AAA family ATPase [Rhizobium leguminosarum]|uniref:AAA family ATPase n=1 Tax=Rhizobium leguminosarum TaxID=384 RepID=UPI0013EE70E1|nr:AAA family ATPase [Rhizobium leguminosarum]
MWIERVTVEGGVLDGFEEEFHPRLNVLIGGRGTGKSSVIELIRFCLGAATHSKAAAKDAAEHALGVLGDGRVTLTIRDDEHRTQISRTALQDVPDVDGQLLASPFVFSQSEIESIGLQASSRLQLIDGFLSYSGSDAEARSAVSRVSSVTAEIRALLNEIDDITEKTADLPSLQLQLNALTAERASLSSDHGEIDLLRQTLEEVTPSLASAHVRHEAIARSADKISDWVERLESNLERRPTIEAWPSQVGTPDELADLRLVEQNAVAQVQTGLEELRKVARALHQRKGAAASLRAGLENRAREIRVKMEERQKGTSALERRIVDATQHVSVLSSLIDLRQDRQDRLKELEQQRSSLLSKLDDIRQARTVRRQEVVSRLNAELGPNVRLTLLPFAQQQEYISALAGALRGSGLRYMELADRIAEAFSPTEIAILSERRDLTEVSTALGISLDRALRLCDALRSSSGSDLFSTVVEDDVAIELLDGTDFKGIDFLSMGQRCTTILPIILRHMERMIVLDQPEDHLDNAFVVNTLVRAIASRSENAQTIVATHNPNIPVIGNADRVYQLDSDGSNCFVRVRGELTSPPVVTAISTIMEGGRDAFQRRADFYSGTSVNVFG